MTLEGREDAPQKSGFKWGKALLIASLALNLLFIGSMARAVWHHHGHRGERGFMSFVRELPAEKRDDFRKKVQTVRARIGPLRAELRTKWNAANAMLGEEPFDKAKFKAALDGVADAEKQFRIEIYDSIVATAEGMSLEERRAFQEWRQKRQERRMRRHKDWKKD